MGWKKKQQKRYTIQTTVIRNLEWLTNMKQIDILKIFSRDKWDIS